jgi:hypothetical protein
MLQLLFWKKKIGIITKETELTVHKKIGTITKETELTVHTKQRYY